MVNSLDDTIFKRMFRVDRNTFDYILRKIEPLLSRNEVKAINSSGEVVTARTRLAVSLRWLAGGSYLDICFAILDGCVLALDGLGVNTRCPYKTEVSRPKDYRFRKCGFAIIVLAGCDIKGRFVCASCDHSGSTNDVIAWQDSMLFHMLEVDKLLPSKYFFIGDEAFNTTDQFLSPWPGKYLCF